MEKKYIQPFLRAAENVSEQFFGIPVVKSSISLDETLELEKEYIMGIGIVGKGSSGGIRGIAAIGMSNDEAERLKYQALKTKGLDKSSKVIQSLSITEWIEMKDSALEEFANQMTGYVTKLYAEEQIHCDITVPRMLTAQELRRYNEESVRFEVQNKLANIVMKLYIK